MDIAVIGAGYVGLTTAACLAQIGHKVLCAESNLEKLDRLRSGELPFFEPHLEQVVESNRREGRLEFATTDEAIERGQAIFICVGTPPLENGEADLSAIELVARMIARQARGYRLVIEKSTVPVQTGARLRNCLARYRNSQLDYDVVSNPEFLCEGSAVKNFLHPDRIVVGLESRRAAEAMRQIYQPVLDGTFTCPVHPGCERGTAHFLVTDTNSAELIKHASNSFLAMKISFINLIADLCEAAGGDVQKVAEGIGLDPRIGPAFLRPGIGFGGFCFPKDLQAFVRIAEKFGCDFSLLKEVERINNRRTEQFVAKLKNELWILRGKRVAVWGLAFKPNTDDVRFAPSLAIIRRLIDEGVSVQAYDPCAMPAAAKELQNVSYCDDPYKAARGAEAILILTEWDEFRSLDWATLLAIVERPLILDGRNMLATEDLSARGFQYVGVGLPTAQALAEVAAGV